MRYQRASIRFAGSSWSRKKGEGMSVDAPAGSETAAVEAAADALRMGGIVLIDDPVRPERGGILAAAAELVNDDVVNFMATWGRSIIATAISPARAERLGLQLQGPWSDDLDRENYLTSIEAREGVTTGISANDRALTILATADERTRSEDLDLPGHIFPARAAQGGLIAREGWAEACLDLARIAGVGKAVAFCHVLNEQGAMASAEERLSLAENHGLPRVGIAALISHRMSSETFVVQQAQTRLPTRHGDFVCRVFTNRIDGREHLALTLGEVRSNEPVLVRLHSECLTGDVFHSLRCDCGSQLNTALEQIQRAGRGVLLYLQQEGRGIGIVSKVKAYGLQDQGRDTVEANHELGFDADLRDFGVGAQILLVLGAHKLKLLTNNPRKVRDMESYGLSVVERVNLEFEPGEHNRSYLEAKKSKLGHLLTKV